MGRSRTRIAAALLLAGGAALTVVPAAQAYTAADAELTITQTEVFPEGGTIEMALACPAGSTYGQIIVAPADASISPPFSYDDELDSNGEVSWALSLEGLTPGEPYDAPPGMNVFFTGHCFTDDSMETTVGGADSAQIVVPSWGMSASAPSSVALNDPIPVTASCGTPPSGFTPQYFEVVVYDGSTAAGVLTTDDAPGPLFGYEIGTPASYGFADADAVRLLVICLGSYLQSPTDIGASRYVNFVVGGRGVTPEDPDVPKAGDPATPVDTGTLSYTGPDYTLIPFVAVLLTGGAVLVAAGTRRRQGTE